jgi:predicted  nucleic acid-binding Zn-ribbon protein
MNDSARRRQLEQEFEEVDREYKAALWGLSTAAGERDKLFAAVEPLKPLEDAEASDYAARVTARERFDKWDAEVKRLRAEHQRLLQELDGYR